MQMEFVREEIWLQQLGGGEEKAYELLFSRYYSLLSVFACRYLNDSALAEDAVHDVFLNLYLQKEKFDSVLSLKSYLYRSVRNKCLNILKHRKIQEKYITESEEVEGSEFYYFRMLETETYELLRGAIGELQEPTRKIYDMVLLGFDNAEIAEQLEMTLDAVKAQKKRGKKLLKERLQNLLVLFFWI